MFWNSVRPGGTRGLDVDSMITQFEPDSVCPYWSLMLFRYDSHDITLAALQVICAYTFLHMWNEVICCLCHLAEHNCDTATVALQAAMHSAMQCNAQCNAHRTMLSML